MPYGVDADMATHFDLGKTRTRLVASLTALSLLLVGFALRVYRLPAQSLWYDEGVSGHSRCMSLPRPDGMDGQRHPAASLLLPALAAGSAPGRHLRVRAAFPLGVFRRAHPATAVGCGAPAFLASRCPPCEGGDYPLAKIGDYRWLALVIGAVSPLQVYYAQEARMYTLLTMPSCSSNWPLLSLLDGWMPTWRRDYPTTLRRAAPQRARDCAGVSSGSWRSHTYSRPLPHSTRTISAFSAGGACALRSVPASDVEEAPLRHPAPRSSLHRVEMGSKG